MVQFRGFSVPAVMAATLRRRPKPQQDSAMLAHLSSRSRRRISTAILLSALFVALGGWAISAPDKYTLQVPGGLAFSEFRGYEKWEVIAVARTEALLKVIVGNPIAMQAFREGIPGNGKPFPDGARMAKVEWHPKKSTEAPYDIAI